VSSSKSRWFDAADFVEAGTSIIRSTKAAQSGLLWAAFHIRPYFLHINQTLLCPSVPDGASTPQAAFPIAGLDAV